MKKALNKQAWQVWHHNTTGDVKVADGFVSRNLAQVYIESCGVSGLYECRK